MPIDFKYCLPFSSSVSPITDWKRGEGNPRSVTTSPGGDVTAHHSQSMWSGTLPKPGDNKSISPRYSELCQHACTGEPSGGVDGWINGGVTTAACVGKVTEKAQFQQPVSAPCCHRATEELSRELCQWWFNVGRCRRWPNIGAAMDMEETCLIVAETEGFSHRMTPYKIVRYLISKTWPWIFRLKIGLLDGSG